MKYDVLSVIAGTRRGHAHGATGENRDGKSEIKIGRGDAGNQEKGGRHNPEETARQAAESDDCRGSQVGPNQRSKKARRSPAESTEPKGCRKQWKKTRNGRNYNKS